MGGLRKELPVTYATFLIGTLAIAGVPFLAGFFSKDEILGKTFASGHVVLWLVGVVTAFLTATYMFRLFFMTFFGERRSGTGHSALGTGAHGAHQHDAPPAMAIALVVLAFGSIVAGYVGIPIWSQGDQIGAFLAPSFEAHGPAVAGQSVQPVEPEPEHESVPTELALMGVSTMAALGGIGVAAFFWYRKPAAADAMAARFSGLHRLLLGKYFVDEFYNTAVVQPIKAVSTGLLWRGVDSGLIDGTVNAVGLVVRGWSAVLRRLQTGSVRAYAMSLFLGVVTILGYLLWKH
jgi:NADH-quinone oxidoreductase subunit L